MQSPPGQPLAGGRTTPGVVRVGDTVRRLPGSNASFVHALLRDLDARGFAGAPRMLGRDEAGREVLSYLAGEVPTELGAFSDEALTAAARLLRALHDATAASALRGSAEVVCHGDPSPCNAVFRAGTPYAFIDFDAARPGRRADDVGYGAWLWLDFGNADWTAEAQGARLGAFVAAYGPMPAAEAVDAVLEAQAALAERAEAPEAARAWALACHAWTVSHRDAILHAALRVAAI